MRPDEERLLRQAAGGLVGPSVEATRRARQAALEMASRPRAHRRRVMAAGSAALAAMAAMVMVGSIALPDRGVAGSRPTLGFQPASGWHVLQTGGAATPERPGAVVAANVPLSPEDDVAGLPYSTLRSLGRDGIVVLATFVRQVDADGRALPFTDGLPLRLEGGTAYGSFSADVRPERPLGQYQLRALLAGHWVDVVVYFGARRPSPGLLDEAQRQLDRLVVTPGEEERGQAPRASARAERVTLAFQRYWYPAGNYFQFRFYGTISSGRAGEYVAVLKRECGASYSTAIAGAVTQPGGAWEAVPAYPPGGGEFRARWTGELSEPVVYRPPITVWLEKVAPGRFAATVSTYTPAGGKAQSMKGRRIDLQRLSAGRWVRMRTARLALETSDAFQRVWTATFPVRTKRLRLRAFVPGQSALPCFAAAASKPLRS